jgi:hypothetical protein
MVRARTGKTVKNGSGQLTVEIMPEKWDVIPFPEIL